MGEAVEPSESMVIAEDPAYLAFPAIARAGDRLIVIYRQGRYNDLDYDARILWVYSDDRGRTWSEPEEWYDEDGGDCRNCGGGTLRDGRAVFVFDVHGGDGAWRRTFFRETQDGRTWSPPVRLEAEEPGQTITSVGNRALEWRPDRLYFPHFRGYSILYQRLTGTQTALPSIPRIEPAVAFNRHGEMISVAKGGPVDISRDGGESWWAAGQLTTISQPDLILIEGGPLLFCYSGKERDNEFLLLSETGHDLDESRALMIFRGAPVGMLTDRGKAQCMHWEDEILTVLYEARGEKQATSRIYLVRTRLDDLTRRE